MQQVGEQFGAYKLVRSLGSGGFATVWLGEHTIMGTKAAIKILNMHLPEDEEQQQRHLEEARTTARLDHPNIVRVLDCNIQNNALFLVLAYAPNGTLRDRHAKGTRVPLPDVVSYTKQIAAGLQYAHDKRLIHCDVKPANMLLGPNNEIWLSDFGVAKIAHSLHTMPLPKLEEQEVIGTAVYMAPEQFNGQPVARSDQYALGVVIYEWLSGDLPFKGTAHEIALQQQVVSLNLRDKVPGLSPAVEQVVLQALKAELKERFLNVQDFAEALEQAANISYQILSEESPAVSVKPTSQEPPGDDGVHPQNSSPLTKENTPPDAISVNPLPNKDSSPPIEPQDIIQPQDKRAPQQQEPPPWPTFPSPPKSLFHDSPTSIEPEPDSIIQPGDKGAPRQQEHDWWSNPPPPLPNSPPTEPAPRPVGTGMYPPPPPFVQPAQDQTRVGPVGHPPPIPPAEQRPSQRKKRFDPNFYKSPKNGVFLYGGIIVDIGIALLLFFWLQNVKDAFWSQNAGNVLLLSPLVLVIVRGLCASALRKHIARPFAWILALSWGLAAYALINIVPWAKNLWALILVFTFLGWLLQNFLYASKKPGPPR